MEIGFDFEDGWNFLKWGITMKANVLHGMPQPEFTADDQVTLSRTVYDLCIRSFTKQLHERLQQTLNEYIDNFLTKNLEMSEFVRQWHIYKTLVKWLSRVFRALDDSDDLRDKELTSVRSVAMTAFHNLVYHAVHNDVTSQLIHLIDKHRQGEEIDGALLKEAVGVFVEMGSTAYEDDFERPLLEAAASYYSPKAAVWVVECGNSCRQYMIKVEDTLKLEKLFASHYLHSTSELKLVERVAKELLRQHGGQLLKNNESGCGVMVRDSMVDDLSRIYSLFSLIPKGLEDVAQCFKECVVGEGRSLLKIDKVWRDHDINSKVDVLQRIFELQDKHVKYVLECFMNDPLCCKALKDAFGIICNLHVGGSSFGEVLSMFCHNILNSSRSNDENIEDTLEKIATVFSYLKDRHLFGELYKKKLAERLLRDEGANVDIERKMLTKLNQQSGEEFISKMEAMVDDLISSKDEQSHYEEYVITHSHRHPGFELCVRVLSDYAWPTCHSFGKLNLPAVMSRCLDTFKESYDQNRKNRKLRWAYSLGSTNIIWNLESNRSKELIATTFQASALLLFNDSKRLSYLEMKSQLGLSDEDAVKLLESLACTKCNVLIKVPDTNTVKKGDVFEVNPRFHHTDTRITLPRIKEDLKEKENVAKDLNVDRQYEIKACIMRIMKSKQALGHEKLLEECREQLAKRFSPDMKLVRKQIDGLIDSNFLERDNDNPNTYKYSL